MAKQGMSRPEWTHTQPKNTVAAVPGIQGKAKHGKTKVHPIISDTKGPAQKVFHTEKPISKQEFPADTDLARDNLENDLPAADLEDL